LPCQRATAKLSMFQPGPASASVPLEAEPELS
jgi:hypothetical protein